MQITFLGTGTSQGVPVIGCSCVVCTSKNVKDQRLRTSVLIEVDSKHIVIDTGPDFRQQMLRIGVKQLDAVLFTHEHKDHLAGLDDVRAYNFLQQKDMPIYAEKRVLAAIQNEFHYAFSKHAYPGTPKFETHAITDDPFSIDYIPIVPIRVMHHKLPILGYRIHNFTYITDANLIDDSALEKIKGSEVVVLNALRREPHLSHFNLEQALELLEQIKPKKAYLTHISHYLGLHNEVSLELPNFVSLAYDGLQIKVN